MPPAAQLRPVRDGVRCHFVSLSRQRLQQRVVCVVVADEEGEAWLAAVWVRPVGQYPLKEHLVVDHSQRVVETDRYHLRSGAGSKTSGDVRASAAALRERACFWYTLLCDCSVD